MPHTHLSFSSAFDIEFYAICVFYFHLTVAGDAAPVVSKVTKLTAVLAVMLTKVDEHGHVSVSLTSDFVHAS